VHCGPLEAEALQTDARHRVGGVACKGRRPCRWRVPARRTAWWCRITCSRGCTWATSPDTPAASAGCIPAPRDRVVPAPAGGRGGAVCRREVAVARTLASSWGSVENSNVPFFHSLEPAALPDPRDLGGCSPTRLASSRDDHWSPQVLRRFEQRVPQHLTYLVVIPTALGRPGRGCSSNLAKPRLVVLAAPLLHARLRHPHQLADLQAGVAPRCQQHNPRPLRFPRRDRPRSHSSL
jgi:hypothetical protein